MGSQHAQLRHSLRHRPHDELLVPWPPVTLCNLKTACSCTASCPGACKNKGWAVADRPALLCGNGDDPGHPQPAADRSAAQVLQIERQLVPRDLREGPLTRDGSADTLGSSGRLDALAQWCPHCLRRFLIRHLRRLHSLVQYIFSTNSLTMPGAFCRDLSSAEDGARALQAMAGWTDGSLCSWPLQQGWEPVARHTAPWHTVQGIL